jgi:hypothetical protein
MDHVEEESNRRTRPVPIDEVLESCLDDGCHHGCSEGAEEVVAACDLEPSERRHLDFLWLHPLPTNDRIDALPWILDRFRMKRTGEHEAGEVPARERGTKKVDDSVSDRHQAPKSGLD